MMANKKATSLRPESSKHENHNAISRSINSKLNRDSHNEIRRILRCGYPPVTYHQPNDEGNNGYMQWWAEDDREIALRADYEDALSNADCEDALCNGEYDEIDEAFNRLVAHQEDVVKRTVDALRQHGNIRDLCNLIDAAAKIGESTYPDTSAGMFLNRIAELALAGLEKEGRRNV